MRTQLHFTALSLLTAGMLLAETSNAQTPTEPAANAGSRFGLGAEVTTTGLVGPTFICDFQSFRLDVLAAGHFAPGDSTLAGAARFFFRVAKHSAADFSIGPGVGFAHHFEGGPSSDELEAELAAQIRAFVVENVALSASFGVGARFGLGRPSNVVDIGGQVGGAFGLAYYF